MTWPSDDWFFTLVCELSGQFAGLWDYHMFVLQFIPLADTAVTALSSGIYVIQ
jgi:hypothetical protein